MFHYVSVYLILSSVALLLVGFGTELGGDSELLVRFIAANYACFALWQLCIAAASKIPRGVLKLFQWMFFMVIAILSFLGTLD